MHLLYRSRGSDRHFHSIANPHQLDGRDPESGWYEPLNAFGTPTGVRIFIEQGAPAPAAPRGHVWRLVQLDSRLALRHPKAH
jgi:hypothetical protein